MEKLKQLPLPGLLSSWISLPISCTSRLLMDRPRPVPFCWEVLALDEASSGLDEGYREVLLSWMENFLAGGGCAVWCTHLPDELERLCTSCMTLREGRAYWGDGPVPL